MERRRAVFDCLSCPLRNKSALSCTFHFQPSWVIVSKLWLFFSPPLRGQSILLIKCYGCTLLKVAVMFFLYFLCHTIWFSSAEQKLHFPLAPLFKLWSEPAWLKKAPIAAKGQIQGHFLSLLTAQPGKEATRVLGWGGWGVGVRIGVGLWNCSYINTAGGESRPQGLFTRVNYRPPGWKVWFHTNMQRLFFLFFTLFMIVLLCHLT